MFCSVVLPEVFCVLFGNAAGSILYYSVFCSVILPEVFCILFGNAARSNAAGTPKRTGLSHEEVMVCFLCIICTDTMTISSDHLPKWIQKAYTNEHEHNNNISYSS